MPWRESHGTLTTEYVMRYIDQSICIIKYKCSNNDKNIWKDTSSKEEKNNQPKFKTQRVSLTKPSSKSSLRLWYGFGTETSLSQRLPAIHNDSTRMLGFCHIVGMPDKTAASLNISSCIYNLQVYIFDPRNEGPIQWWKTWINSPNNNTNTLNNKYESYTYMFIFIHIYIYIYIYIHIYVVMYLPNPSTQAGYDTRSIFCLRLTGLNSEFPFS